MRRQTLRNRIAESDLTFVVALLLTAAVWMAGHWDDSAYWGGLGMTILTAYGLLELNNRCHLLRIRSRMVSSTYLILMAALPALHTFSISMLVPLLCIAALYILFSVYQQREPVGQTFYSFLLLGLAALLLPPLALLLPVLWFGCSHHLRIFSLRTWAASVVGFLLPHFYHAIACLLASSHDTILMATAQDWLAWWHITPPHIPTTATIINLALILGLIIWAWVHFNATSFKDNTRTRVIYNVLLNALTLLIPLPLLWASHTQEFLLLIIAIGAPVVGHYFALAENRSQDRWIWIWFLLLVGLGICNHIGCLPLTTPDYSSLLTRL